MASTDSKRIKLRIDIISDVVCPWCIIGYKRLEQALDQLSDQIDTELHWQPFQLNPQMPPGGQNLREHLAQKYGTTLEQSIAARQRLTALGAELGFQFNYFDEMRTYNTFKAHQLLHWAHRYHKQTALKLELFKAFFGQGKAIDQDDALIEAAQNTGLETTEAARTLREETYAAEVKNQAQQWLNAGIHAVPSYVLDRQYLISGAQDSALFKTQIEKMIKKAA